MSHSQKSRLLPRQIGQNGFSLIEMLTVMAIIGVLAATVVPPLFGVMAGTSATSATLELSSFLEQSRLYATGNNTYVFVSLLPTKDDANRPELWATAIASNDGSNLYNTAGTTFTLGSGANNARQITKIMKIKGFVMKKKGDIDATVVPRPAGSSDIINISTNGKTFTAANGTVFPVSYWYAPDGSANLPSGLPSRLEVAIQPNQKQSTSAADAAWASVFQIAGLTGTVRVYRAN